MMPLYSKAQGGGKRRTPSKRSPLRERYNCACDVNVCVADIYGQKRPTRIQLRPAALNGLLVI